MRPAGFRGRRFRQGVISAKSWRHLVCLRRSTKAVWLEQGGQGGNHGGRSPREWSQTDDGPGSLGSTLDFTERGGEILKGFRWSGILKELLPLLFKEKLKLIMEKAMAGFQGSGSESWDWWQHWEQSWGTVVRHCVCSGGRAFRGVNGSDVGCERKSGRAWVQNWGTVRGAAL